MLLIRSLFLTAIALFISVGTYAQNQIPVKWTSDNSIKTLNCTEDAITLKLSVRAGWHINSLHLGNAAPVKSYVEFPSSIYSTKGLVLLPDAPVKYKAMADTGAFLRGDTTFKLTTLRNSKATNVLDKLSDIHWANKTPIYTGTNFMISPDNKPLSF
ncbi:hypothetical protein [Mucilaginibacter aquaedulcis]|uniref:hypothetical protein n=1 Tax=Mucilaginibacter aquaedulcis TaxID=1187081 RepID=UPI0025B36D9C|nr:hypothetical protein [Mucilaginibacter aquaedulcis]MDN3549303.1 hypothetical protein [Mucilaginibacter aquaedulcis]